MSGSMRDNHVKNRPQSSQDVEQAAAQNEEDHREYEQSSRIYKETIEEDLIIDTFYVERYFNLNEKAKEELSKITSLDFNMFNMQKETNNNELISTLTYMLAKEDIFSDIEI